jgi:molybdopterin/thiamine biosynthesis adenylyltransferase
MLDPWEELEKRQPGLLERIEAKLTETSGNGWARLREADLEGYPRRPFVGGWRLPITFSDNAIRRLDILIHPWFPHSPPRTAMVDHPDFLVWPHVERDGILCLLPNMHEVNVDDPVGVIVDLIGRSCRAIEELIEGTIVERDFREEFLTYWAYDTNFGTACLNSILDPSGPSRSIRIWRGRAFRLLGENDDALTSWLTRRFDSDKPTAFKFEDAVFIWRETPLLPSQYPRTAKELLDIASATDDDAVAAIETALASGSSDITAIIGSIGRGGPGLISVIVPAPVDRVKARGKSDPLHRGFRKGAAPTSLLMQRFLGSSEVKRVGVFRADAPWVHGRGRDARTASLLKSAVTLFGAGSIGGPLVSLLLKAGVGTVHVVDFDTLSWANVGRHELGATSVGENKALALATKLQREYPHLTVVGHDAMMQSIIAEKPDWFLSSALIVSVTGSWSGENALNDWHKASGRAVPIVYGWTEAHAVAGHAVAIGQTGGCLRSGIDPTGVPAFQVAKWTSASTMEEEPACGAHYQPYGPVELGHVVNVIGELVLDGLLGKISTSTHRIWIGRAGLLSEAGGEWTEEFLQLPGATSHGGQLLDRTWSPMCGCCEIGQSRAA